MILSSQRVKKVNYFRDVLWWPLTWGHRFKSNNQLFTVTLKYSFPTCLQYSWRKQRFTLLRLADTTLELTWFIISPNKLLLTVSERLVNLRQLPQHALIYIKPYTGHDNQNSPHRGQSTPVRSVLLLFNLEGFYASSASLQGELHIPA